MKKISISFIVCLIITTVIIGCVKETPFVESHGTETSRTFLKIAEAPQRQLFFEPFSEVRNVKLFSLVRTPNNEAELSKTSTVTITLDTAAIRSYNQANNETFARLPDSLFSLAGNDFTKTGDLTYQAVFGPGEIEKSFTIGLNGAKWDVSNKYAAPFIISDGGSVVMNSGKEKIFTMISVKNIYDGKYTLKFSFYHPTASPDYGASSANVELHTSGSNSVKIYWPAAGGYYHPILSGGALSYFAAQEPEYTVDPGTNKVSVQNAYPGAVTFYSMAQGYDSRYDPATKTFYVKFGYGYTGGAFDGAASREWVDTLIYIGPR